MKKKIITLLFVITAFIGTTAFIVSSKHAAGFAGYTNSPTESNCGSCHSGGSSSATGISITALPSFNNNNYIPGNTYTITVTTAASGFNNYGFGCEILNISNTNAGSMQNAGSGVKFLTAGNGRKNAVQSATKAGSGSATFNFEWIAPTSGSVTVYVGANAVNGNGNSNGDIAFNASLVLSAAPDVGIKETTTSPVLNVSFFPNPAHDFATLNYSIKETKKIRIQLMDIKGNPVHEFLNETRSGDQSHWLSLQGIVPGIYFLKLSGNEHIIAQKLIFVN